MADDLVAVATFASLTEAQMARGFLEAHGIEAFVADEEAARIYTGLSLSPVTLQVRRSDENAALRLLASVESEPSD